MQDYKEDRRRTVEREHFILSGASGSIITTRSRPPSLPFLPSFLSLSFCFPLRITRKKQEKEKEREKRKENTLYEMRAGSSRLAHSPYHVIFSMISPT